ncbi:hypothetical protein ACOI1C_14590 [Bacillus sp. DJP31]|uniref:hypothetical protein n=1 Tax=Bacillus sp. DJP31 TaxID=3409789 RepID=UPI003BB7DD3B
MRTKTLGQLGIGITSVLLISRWLSANAMFTASEATMTYGIIAGLLFGIMGAIAFFTFGLIGKKARQQNEGAHSLMDLVQDKLDQKTKNTLFLLIGISYSIEFLLLAIGASILFYATFHLPIWFGVLLFILVGLPLLLFRFIRDIGKYAIYKIGIFQSIIIILFVYLFLSSDLEKMFFGMKLYHPYMFTIQIEELFIYTLAIFLIFLGKLLTDFGTWNILFRIKKEKISQSFILSGSIWATIPLCFSIMIFPALSLGGFRNVTTLFYDLLNLLESPVFLLISASTLLATLMTTYFSKLNDFLQLFETKGFQKRKKTVYLTILFTIVVLYGGYLLFRPDIIELFFFTGVINASLLFPVLFIIFIKRKVHHRLVLITVLLSIMAGYLPYPSAKPIINILDSSLTSILILGVYTIRMK